MVIFQRKTQFKVSSLTTLLWQLLVFIHIYFISSIFVFFPLRILKELRKSYQTIIFVSATKISENTTNILNCYFLSLIRPLAQQNNRNFHCRKSKYHNLTPFEYPLAFQMATKLKSRRPGNFITPTILNHDMYNCT